MSQRSPVYSVRVSIDYRASGELDDGDTVWFWIGYHQEYDRLLKRMRMLYGAIVPPRWSSRLKKTHAIKLGMMQ